VQRDDIAIIEQGVEIDQFHLLFRCPGVMLVRVRSVDHDLHAESFGNLCHLSSDLPTTDDAEGFTRQLGEWTVAEAEIGAADPAPFMDQSVMVSDLLSYLQQQGKDHLRDRSKTVAGDVADDNTGVSGSFDIDNIVTGGEDADVAEVRKTGNGFCRENSFVGQ
jgi:hypothetical protein